MRSQISMEFIVSILMFLSMMIMVLSAFIRTYVDYAGEYQRENVYILSERYLQTLVSKNASLDWVNDPYTATDISLGVNGTLNYTFVKTFGAMNYQHIRNLLESNDFNIRVKYLPSLSVNPAYYQSYPQGNMTMSADVTDLQGNPVNATVYGVLVPVEGDTSVASATYGYGRHFWSFTDVAAGHHKITVVAFDGVRYGLSEFEVDIT